MVLEKTFYGLIPDCLSDTIPRLFFHFWAGAQKGKRDKAGLTIQTYMLKENIGPSFAVY